MLKPGDIAIVSGARTPFGRYCGKIKDQHGAGTRRDCGQGGDRTRRNRREGIRSRRIRQRTADYGRRAVWRAPRGLEQYVRGPAAARARIVFLSVAGPGFAPAIRAYEAPLSTGSPASFNNQQSQTIVNPEVTKGRVELPCLAARCLSVGRLPIPPLGHAVQRRRRESNPQVTKV